MLHSYGNGLVIALGLIMAIGAQNAFVLSQALRHEHHLWVAGVCVFFDVLLVACGVYGLAQILTNSAVLMAVARWGGVLFLSVFMAHWLCYERCVKIAWRWLKSARRRHYAWF